MPLVLRSFRQTLFDGKAARWAVASSAAFLLSSGCATRSMGPERLDRLEPALVQVMETRPDSVIGVLVQLNRELGEGDRDRLHQLGLTIGSAQGRIVTGTLRAADARRLTRWPAVEWVELSNAIGSGSPRTKS